MKTIDSVIQRLGYHNSKKLFYLSDIDGCADLSWHARRVMHELAPYAVYAVDGSVIAMFFEDLDDRAGTGLHGKIWNAQIPVVISDEGGHIKVYDGKRMGLGDDKRIKLKDIASCGSDQCDEKTGFSYWNVADSLSSGYYGKNAGAKGLNDLLIDNLKHITKRLKDEHGISFANKLMLMVLFIRYLIDRGIDIGYMGLDDDVKRSQEAFLRIVQNKDDLIMLVRHLKGRFNGNLFEIGGQKERDELTQGSLAMLHDFLTGREEMRTGQLCLFPFYDFNIIPIELISNIYEILLGKEKQGRDKAFYTPGYLADYIVDRTVGRHLAKGDACKVLDPACGSGIFLVKSLQRILERNAGPDGLLHDKEKIDRLVRENIFGVDRNEEAVDITIFSLYVTLFEYQDPKSLHGFRLPSLKDENILHGDFFDDSKMEPLKGTRFRFILGNPPWGSADQQNYRDYCDGKGVIAQDKEISIAFLLKAQELGDQDTECSLVMPSKILYKGKRPSVELRKRLLDDVQLEQVLELSAVRKQGFKGASAPAAVLSFLCKKRALGHKIEYISVKPNRYLKPFGVMMIGPDDVKHVEQALFMENDGLWKILVYGGYWDLELISTVRNRFRTVKDVALEHKLVMKKGLQDSDGDKDASHLAGRKILDSDKAIGHFYFDEDACSILDKPAIRRTVTPEIYQAPYVLFKKGLDSTDYTIRAAYAEKDFLFREAINCIKGTAADKKVLLNLCGLLNSSLFSYFNLMLGSSAGIEREQVFLKELEGYPYAYSEELVGLAQRALQEGHWENGGGLKTALNECVMEMYGLQDDPFVDYALTVQIPLLCGTYREAKCDAGTMKEYASILSRIWDENFRDSGVHHSTAIYPDIKGKFAAVQMKLSFEGQTEDAHVVDDVDEDASLLTNFMVYQLNDSFYQTKSIMEFSEDSFVIVKPIEAKNWHRAMAVKDAHKVVNAVLLGKAGHR